MPIPTLEFGRTGHMSTRTIFGAAALSQVTQAEADQTLDVLLEHGVNHIDTAASYGDAELRIGPWMEKHRDDFFLATKTEKRTYDAGREEFLRSLERLRVDKVDLIQLHYLVGDDEWQVAMGPGGVLEYLLEAKEEGLVDYIGVTGHDVKIAEMHRRSLERYDFDSVLLPYNYLMMRNPVYAEGFKQVLTMAHERNVAVQTIKSITRRPYPSDERPFETWYEPLTNPTSIATAIHWAMGQPGIFVNTVGDISLLPHVLEAASKFVIRPTTEQMEALVQNWNMEPLFT
jgi:aryl-alcohol dehydrogenase-like predicted oxidoreductase